MIRHFIDWDRPLLPEVSGWLLDRGRIFEGAVDLRQTACVLPGRRAGRLLLSALLHEARRRAVSWLPPIVMTPADLEGRLLPAEGPVATDGERRAAWAMALRLDVPRANLEPLVQVNPDEEGIGQDHVIVLARQLDRSVQELARAGISIEQVIDTLEMVDRPEEARRWEAIRVVHDAFRGRLNRANLLDCSSAAWHAVGVLDEETLTAERLSEIVVIGVAEWTPLQRKLLERLDDRVTCVVHAPSSMKDAFDAIGAPRTAEWRDADLSLSDAQVMVADLPADQARAALSCAAEYARSHGAEDGRIPVDEIAFGLCGTDLFETFHRVATEEGVTVHVGAGRLMRETAPVHFLCALRDWLRRPDAGSLAALLRAPGAEALIHVPDSASEGAELGAGAIVVPLERYRAVTFDEPLAALRHFADGTDEIASDASAVIAARSAIDLALQPLRESSDRGSPETARRLVDLLRHVFGEVCADDPAEVTLAQSLFVLLDALRDWAALPGELDVGAAPAALIDLLLEAVQSRRVGEAPGGEGAEVLGWLELPFECAPALVIIGANEGNLPEGDAHDAFLPEALRHALGLPGTDDRAARDAYRLEAILRSHVFVRIIAGRVNELGDPLLPSRLLMRTSESNMPARVRHMGRATRFCVELETSDSESRALFSWNDPPVLPAPMPMLRRLRVTDFRRFIECPYRFALSRLLRLEPPEAAENELSPAQFGSIAHEVLARASEIELRHDEATAETIILYLERMMGVLSEARFGADPPAIVRLQLAQLRARLSAFAQFEVAVRAEGWTTVRTEADLGDVPLEIPGEPSMPMSGRIDRIDRRILEDGRCILRVIDYKTSENAANPLETHLGTRDPKKVRANEEGRYGWRDLQLPLYLHLLPLTSWFDEIRGDDPDPVIEAGYVSIPAGTKPTVFAPLALTDVVQADAVKKAQEIVQEIRRIAECGDVRPNPDVSTEYDPFDRICRTYAPDPFGDDASAEAVETSEAERA